MPWHVQFGIETGALGDDPRKRAEEMRSLTAGIPFVTEALEEGWSLGGKLGDRLGTWTRVWHGDERGVWVAFVSAMGQDELDMPILADAPTPAVLASRLATFADALKFPWAMVCVHDRFRSHDQHSFTGARHGFRSVTTNSTVPDEQHRNRHRLVTAADRR